MSNLLQIQKGQKAYGKKHLFTDATFSINEGEHVGVIGPNGAGKSTLFKAIVGTEELDSGDIIRSRNLRLEYLGQEEHVLPTTQLEDFISEHSVKPLWKLKEIAIGFGFLEEDFYRGVDTFSGGYQMRARLLRILAAEPNLLLLDEPTNYLDLETLLVLENLMQGFEGAFLVISHDREFLRRVTDHTLEIEMGEVTKFPGNIDDYFEEKALLREQLEKRAMSLDAKRNAVLDFAARFGAKASKARQAQSRLKSLDKMEKIELRALPVSARIKLPQPIRTGKQVISVRDAVFGYETKEVLTNVNIDINNGDHIGVVGLNGGGKTTLLKGLSHTLTPFSGTVEWGFQVSLGYYAQHVAQALDPDDTVYEAMKEEAHPDVRPQEIMDIAGSLLFSGDDTRKKIRVLSGGEKSRVALGRILLMKAPCLVLDEPTNHLDFNTVEALTEALHNYPGTVIVVSHDRGFIKRVSTKILETRDGTVIAYPGTYDEYVWSLEKGILGEHVKSASSKPAQKPAPVKPIATQATPDAVKAASSNSPRKKEIDKKLRELEKEISTISGKIEKLEKARLELNNYLILATSSEAAGKVSEMVSLQADIESLEALFFEKMEARQKAEAELAKLLG